jgi:hypothetical protein
MTKRVTPRTTQGPQRAAAIATALLVLQSEERTAQQLPSGAEYDVRITLEAFVDGVRIYEPITAGGLLKTAQKSGKPRFQRRPNYKGI